MQALSCFYYNLALEKKRRLARASFGNETSLVLATLSTSCGVVHPTERYKTARPSQFLSAHYVAFPFARNTCLSLLLDQSFLSRAIIFLSIFSFSSIPTLFIQRLCKLFAIKRAMVSLSFSFTCIARLSTTLSTLYGIFKLDRETFFYLCIQISRICISSLAENAKFFHLNTSAC